MTRLPLLHRRLSVLMGLSGLLAFAGGAGFEPLSALAAAAGLVVALFWQPSPDRAALLERIWLPLALLLVGRALYHVFVVGDDVVVPVVDLLLLLLTAEALRSLDASNDVRMYSLSFALLLAASAYRPGVVFALAFLGYVVSATMALTVGHLRRETERFGGSHHLPGRRFLATTAAFSGVTLAVSALVFVTFPRVSRGWAGRGLVDGAAVAGFGEEVALGRHGATIAANPQIVLRVEFPEGPPPLGRGPYWRGRSYDRFDGVRWSRSRGLPPSRAPTDWYEERWPGPPVRQEIYAAPLSSRVIFAMHPLVGVRPESRIQPVFDNAGDHSYWGSSAPAYTAWSAPGPPDPDLLRGARSGFSPARGFFLQMPPLPDRFHALADSLAGSMDNRWDQAAAIERWFRETFRYTRVLPRTPEEATVESFVFDRRAGHCEYFSTAMVLLLRSLGVPAREVNGFAGGEWNDFGRYLVVTQNEAHSWVEVWFPGFGWVSFDPTPPAGPGAAAGTSWLRPGIFLLDGLQHRWNKWVLDYSLARQSDLLERTGGLLSGEASRPEGAGEAAGGGGWIWGGALAIALLLLLRGVDVRRRSLPPASRLYLRLKRSYRRAGVDRIDVLPPLAFVRAVHEAGLPGAGPAEALVRSYLHLRFGGGEYGPGDLARMRAALEEARGALRGWRPGPAPGDAGR